MPHRQTKSKILVIEDQPEVLELMSLILQDAGYAVVTASNGADGINLARNEAFDLITVDIDLPGINGFEVAAQLKRGRLFHATPIIFVSGRSCAKHRQRALELGAVDFIAKPFDISTLISRIMPHVQPVKTQKRAQA
jgi:DNA-binding response OmpR family regulator